MPRRSVVKQQFSLNKREKEVLSLWRSGDISPGSARTYLDWVRRFYAYCERLGLDEVAELTLEGAWRFARSYVGPRTKGPVRTSSCLIARNALHAWAYAIRALGRRENRIRRFSESRVKRTPFQFLAKNPEY